MQNAKFIMQNENPSTASGPPPFRQGRLSAEVEEIASVQVLFPDRKTLDEVIAEIQTEIKKLKENSAET